MGDELLTDPHRQTSDIKMIARAVRRRWPIPDERKPEIVTRMLEIVKGSPEDGDAIKAAAVLRAMEADNMADDQLAEKNARLDDGKATEGLRIVDVDPNDRNH